MKNCVLLRHGEVDNPKNIFYGRTLDIPLSKNGIEQIKSMANKIEALPFKVTSIHCSPLLRAIQTADIIARKLGLSAEIIEGLIDVDIPAHVGKPISLRKELHTKGEDEYEGVWVKQGNEKRDDIRKRVSKAFNQIKNKNRNGNPIIIGHGDPLIFLLFSLEKPNNGLPRVGELKKNGYEIKKGSAVVLEFNKEGNIEKREELLP